MVRFRKLKLGDLDFIYKVPDLRPLITTPYKGNSFAVVVEEGERIIGGVSGYATDTSAFLKKAIIKHIEQKSLYMDGLIRSLIHFLELDGIEYLFVEEFNPVYLDIGFNKLQGTEEFLIKENSSMPTYHDAEHVYWINVKDFFK